MEIQILFESKDTCKKAFEQITSSTAAYQEQQEVLRSWKKAHKFWGCIVFLLRTAVVFGLIWFFFFYRIPRTFHLYFNENNVDNLVPSIIIDMNKFFILLICAVWLSGYLYKRAILKKAVLPKPQISPEQRHCAHKYENYQLVESLISKKENVQVAIDVALSFGFRSVMDHDRHILCNYAVLNFDREQILFSA